MLPGFLGYLSSQGTNFKSHERSVIGVVVILGVMTGMVVFATAATIFHTSLGGLLTVATPVVVAILFFFGTLLIVNHNPFYRIFQLRIPKMRNNLITGFAYGGLYGIIALPCSSLVILPFTIAVSLSNVSALDAFLLFFLFGFGLGLPVIVVSVLSRANGDWLVREFAKRSRIMNTVAGMTLIGVAIYDLIIVLPFIQIYL